MMLQGRFKCREDGEGVQCCWVLVSCGICSLWGRAVARCEQTFLFSLALQCWCWDSTAQSPGGWGNPRALTKCTLLGCAVVCWSAFQVCGKSVSFNVAGI